VAKEDHKIKGLIARPGMELALSSDDGCQRQLRRVPARAARAARPRQPAAHVLQDRRVLRRRDARHGDGNREAFDEARSSPPINYAKGGKTIDLSFWRAPERLFDEPDELVAWARLALAAARRVASKRGRPAAPPKRSRHAG
jgi:hypothetical protein